MLTSLPPLLKHRKVPLEWMVSVESMPTDVSTSLPVEIATETGERKKTR